MRVRILTNLKEIRVCLLIFCIDEGVIISSYGIGRALRLILSRELFFRKCLILFFIFLPIGHVRFLH